MSNFNLTKIISYLLKIIFIIGIILIPFIPTIYNLIGTENLKVFADQTILYQITLYICYLFSLSIIFILILMFSSIDKNGPFIMSTSKYLKIISLFFIILSIISYKLSSKYGYREKEYLVPKNFTANKEKSRQVVDILKKMKRQINFNASQHSATSHYVNNYGYIPLWVLVKVLSFGIVGELYSILKKEDQMSIADIYGLDVDTLANYLTILSNYRNLCAHEDIVFCNKTQRELEDNVYHKLLNIPIMDDEYIYGKNDLFALIIVLKRMLKDEEFSNFIEEIKHNIENLEMNLHSIKIDKVLDGMGFPKNYYDLKNINEVVK